MLRTRSAKQWMCLFAAGLLAATFNGYGSSGGEGGGTTPRSRTNLGSVVAAAAAAATNDTATNPNAAFTVLQKAGLPVLVANGRPKVNFTVFSDGAVVKGLTNSNARFIIAKLVPGRNGAPDQWVSYVHRTETATAGVGPGGKPVLASAAQATTDSNSASQLVYHSAGYYTYSFSTDIRDRAKTNGVAFEPNRTHRVAIQLSYKNKAGRTVLVNPYFDFTINANGNSVAVTDSARTRKVVDTGTCNECHSRLALHGGGRVDTQYCVLCHNSGTTDANSGNVLDFRTMAHKIHFGEKLQELFGQTYTIWGNRNSAHDYGEVTYPQPIANCAKCHDGGKKSPAGAQLAAQGDNWKNVPSRAACGACHAGIDFASGKGATMADAEADHKAHKPRGTTASGHAGGAQSSDQTCAQCHGPATIAEHHKTVDPTGANGRSGYPLNTANNVPTPGFPAGQGPAIPLASQVGNLPKGVYRIDLEIKQASVSGAAGAKKATVVYRILKDGKPVTLNRTGYLIDQVHGTPDIYIAYAIPRDGIAAPADWNATINAHINDIRDGRNGNSQTGPDTNGYYTAKLGATIPDAARLVTAGLGINYDGFVQLNLPEYPKGIRLREPKFVMKVADGYTGRRPIVSADKCNACHGQLGVAPSFHGGARNNGEGCAFCHDADRATGHVGPRYAFGGGWSVQAKNLIHGIHGSGKRTQAFTYEATAENPNGFKKVTYPGVLKNCEQCHVSGSYDFSGAANKAALPNLPWTTDAKSDMSNPKNAPSIGLSPWVTLLGAGQTDYRSDNLVSSPLSSSCFGCHDNRLAVAHMQANGGTLVTRASTVSIGGQRKNGFSRTETCVLCHGSGKIADIKMVHSR